MAALSSSFKIKTALGLIMGLSVIGLGSQALAGEGGLTKDGRHCLDAHCQYLSLAGFDATGSGASGTGLNGSTIARRFGAWGFDSDGMDRSVKPGDDFNAYANGNALKKIVIPADRSSYGNFDLLAELSENRLHALIDDLSKSKTLKGDEAKIAALYKDMMNEDLAEKLDIKPLLPELHQLAKVKTKAEMAAFMGQTQGAFGGSVMGAYIADDQKNPKFQVLHIGQDGLGLPDRDYYLEASFADKKAKYQIYIAKMLGMIGIKNPEAQAKNIVEFESQIAKVSWTDEARRDANKTYNPMSLAQLSTYAKGFEWGAFFKASGLSQAKVVIVGENTAIADIAKIYAKTPLDTLKSWEALRVTEQASPYLSKRFVTTRWEFYAHDLSGAQAQRPRWKRAIAVTDEGLGEALGRAYVARYFPPESKAKMVSLVADIRSALKARIEALTWMSDQTKAKALEKLSKFGVKIAYPNKWRDYSKLEIKSDDLVGNEIRLGKFNWDYSLTKLDKPIDPEDWGMTPQTVNAYYQPTRNEIVFPAAILQPPFFDPKADMAVNYGGIGAVIGHEMSHGFDDQGRRSDGDGNLTDWWTPEDSKKFEVQTARLGAQYDAFEPLPGIHVKGGLTMGENIGDLGGLLTSIDAYHMSLKGQPAPVIDGFSGDQRLFFGFAQIWRSKYRDDAIKQQVVSDPHSPAQFRAIGTTRNIDLWYDTFGVKEGDKYYVKPEDRVRIW